MDITFAVGYFSRWLLPLIWLIKRVVSIYCNRAWRVYIMAIDVKISFCSVPEFMIRRHRQSWNLYFKFVLRLSMQPNPKLCDFFGILYFVGLWQYFQLLQYSLLVELYRGYMEEIIILSWVTSCLRTWFCRLYMYNRLIIVFL